ncbi:MAG: phospholipase D-like domain-containing protein [Anaerolineaceae bacterium]|nr:phospholipase D-like domain-containing protein [Anaerolineaceae bacterium]MCK9505262.1 phospholipase D-like domain-containing protein [Porticoccaceae bacterium]
MELIFDTVEKRNEIGEILRKVSKEGIQEALIASPYVSNIENLLDFKKISSLHLICDATSPSCNPLTLQALCENKKVFIRSIPNLHAKIYIFDQNLLITSANATPNGLGQVNTDSQGTIEAGIYTTQRETVDKAKKWFKTLWNNPRSVDTRSFSKELWIELESKWRLTHRNNSLAHLSDLITTKSIPRDIAFCFWEEIEDAPSKESVEECLENHEKIDLGLNWDYLIESYDWDDEAYKKVKKSLAAVDGLLVINIRVNKLNNPEEFIFDGIYFAEYLPEPKKFKWGNTKKMTLSLCRVKDKRKSQQLKNFKVDKETIIILNKSLKRNGKAWRNFLISERQGGFCTPKKLYKLLQI